MSADAFIDTDVIIHFLTQDDPEKQAASAELFEAIKDGRLTVVAPDTVIAEAVLILASPRLYDLPRGEVQALLTPLVRLAGFKVDNKRAILEALELYARTDLAFADALVVASMRLADARTLYSYNSTFECVSTIDRRTSVS